MAVRAANQGLSGRVLRRVYLATGGGGGGADPNRTYVYLDADILNNNAVIITWPDPTTDDGLSAWDSGQPTRLTIPSDGYYIAYACVVVEGSGGSNNKTGLEILIDGSGTAVGCARYIVASGITPDAAGRMAETPVLSLTAGQYLECQMRNPNNAGADIVVSDTMPVMMMLYKLPSFSGAQVYFTTDNINVNGDNTPSWDAETFDTGSFWNAGSPTVFTAAGTGYFSATANLSYANIGTLLRVDTSILKNGSVYSLNRGTATGSTQDPLAMQCVSGPIPVVSTDTVAVRTGSSGSNYTQQAAGSSFGVEFHTDDCATVTLASALTAVDADTSPPYIIGWTSETFDDDGFFDSGSNQRLTCSSDGKYQVGFNLQASALGTGFAVIPAFVWIEHYTSGGVLINRYRSTTGTLTSGDVGLIAWTPHLNCTAGEYFRAALEVVGDTEITINTGSKFWLRRFSD